MCIYCVNTVWILCVLNIRHVSYVDCCVWVVQVGPVLFPVTPLPSMHLSRTPWRFLRELKCHPAAWLNKPSPMETGKCQTERQEVRRWNQSPFWMKDNRFLQYDCDSTTVSHLNELFKPPNPHFTFGSKAEQRHVLEPFSSSRPVSKWNALIKSKQLQCTDLTLVLTRAQTSHWVDGLCVRTGSGNERLFLCGNMLPSVVEFNRPSDYCCLLHWQINPVNNNNNSLSLLILQIPVSRSSTSSTRSLSFPGTNSVFFFKLNQRCWMSIKHSLSCLHDLISHVPDSYTQAIMLRC